MNTALQIKWFATHALTFTLLTLPLACSAESDVGGSDNTPVPPADQAEALEPPPAADPHAEPFNLLPEGASNEDGYWISTIGFDDAGKPMLIDAELISEEEMLAHSAAQAAALKAGATFDATAGGVGKHQEALGTQVNCNTFPAAPTYLGLYQFKNFGGNRMCVQGGGNRAWFHLYTWYWGTVQVSGNIGSYVHYKRFSFDAWTDANIDTHPTWFPGAFRWPSTGVCFSGSAAACPNPNGCVGGLVQNSDVTNQCGTHITWLNL